MEKDIIIIGGGPAGLTAAIYASRARLKTLVIEQQSVGGQMAFTIDIENYPGFPDGITGPDLGMLMEKQAKKHGAEIIYDSVVSIDADKKAVVTSGATYTCKALILTLGAEPTKMGIEKEDALRGRGISYCATCDGAFFRDQVVAVVGGGNTALEEALFLTTFASKVYVIHRRDKFRGEKCVQDKVLGHPKIEVLWNTTVSKILGDDGVKGIVLKDVKTAAEKEIALDGLFIFVGYTPRTESVKNIVRCDENGYIITDRHCQTSLPWIFAAGDCMAKPYKQIATAVGDGCTAAMSAIAFIEKES